jgi:BirA family biotin operon repressor/biotin-[acetyl-CoA-carboxylase] ligase
METKILDFLRDRQSYISGEDVSRRLKISRAAVWKYIRALRRVGYDIVAVPHQGYRLISSPDKLLPQEITWGLGTQFIGKKIYYYTRLTSTMDVAINLGLNNAPEGTIVCAESQIKGRGRLGRSWFSPKSKGIYISLILRPKLMPLEVPKLTLLIAVAVVEAIKKNTGIQAAIKWPNDIMIKEKKLGGILTELNAEQDVVRFAAIGIGLNVNNDKEHLPLCAISLREYLNEKIPRLDLLKEILRHVEREYIVFTKTGFGPVLRKWRRYSSTLGRHIKVACRRGHIEGKAIDLDIDGSLLVRKACGFIEKVTSGDVMQLG